MTDRLEEAERLLDDGNRFRGGRASVSHDYALFGVLGARHNYERIKEICRDRLQNLDNIPFGNLNMFLYNRFLDEALMHLGQIDEALRVNEQTILQAHNELDTMNARLRRVEMLRLADRQSDAMVECEKLLKDYPQPKYARMVRLRMASLLSHARKFAESEKVLRGILENDPNDVMALNMLGFELADQGLSLDEAERMIRRALDLDRRARRFGEGEGEDSPLADEDNPAYSDSLAWVLFRKGQFAEARSVLEKAVAQRDGREEPTLWDHLGDIRYRLGDAVKARDAWEKAREYLRRDPAAKKDGRLDEISRKLNALK